MMIPDNGREREDICYTLFVISFMQIRIKYLNETPIINDHNVEKRLSYLRASYALPSDKDSTGMFSRHLPVYMQARSINFLCNTIEL